MVSAPSTFQKSGTNRPGSSPRDKQQLRKDRISALIVLAIFAALIGLAIWLASFGESVPVDEFWPMMP